MLVVLLITQFLLLILFPIAHYLLEKQIGNLKKSQEDWIAKHQHWITIFEKKHNEVPKYVQECLDLYMKDKDKSNAKN